MAKYYSYETIVNAGEGGLTVLGLLLIKVNRRFTGKWAFRQYVIQYYIMNIRYSGNKTSNMNMHKADHAHPIVQMVRNFINKLIQNPDVYPIKYYKKNHRHKRNWKTPMVK